MEHWLQLVFSVHNANYVNTQTDICNIYILIGNLVKPADLYYYFVHDASCLITFCVVTSTVFAFYNFSDITWQLSFLQDV